MTIVEATKSILYNLNVDFITHNNLINQVCNIVNKDYESVRGSLFISRNKGFDWFNKDFIYINKNGDLTEPLIVKLNSNLYKEKYNQYKYSYNSETKQLAREFIFSNVMDGDKILTFAGNEGFDVKYLLENFGYIEVYNIERDINYLNEYEKHNYPTTNYNMDFNSFYRNSNIKFDLINYDSISYLCQTLAKDFVLLNEKKNSKYIAITIMNIEKIRNVGCFAEEMRNKYRNIETPTTNYIVETFTNYDLVETYVYKRNPKSQPMKIYYLKIKQSK